MLLTLANKIQSAAVLNSLNSIMWINKYKLNKLATELNHLDLDNRIKVIVL